MTTNLRHKLLDIVPQDLRLLQGGEVPALVMLPVEDQIPRQLDPSLGHGGDLVLEPREAERLVDVPFLGRVGLGAGPKRLTVRPEAGGGAAREPVEGDGLEDDVQGRVVVGPLHELLADPREQRHGAAAQHEPDGAGPRRVLHRIGAARPDELVAALDAPLLELADGALQPRGLGGRHGRRVEVCGFAAGVLCRQGAGDPRAHVAALGDVRGQAELAGDEAVEDARGVVDGEVLVQRRRRGEGVARQAGDDQVVRQVVGGPVARPQQFEHGHELEETPRPAVDKHDRDRVLAPREHAYKVHLKVVVQSVVVDGRPEVRERVDVFFLLPPVEPPTVAVFPMLLGRREPVVSDPEASVLCFWK